MPTVRVNGAKIHYKLTPPPADRPDAEPVVMLHGYTASAQTNWEYPGFVAALAPAHRLLLPDFRGHGQSQKFLRSGSYSRAILAADVIALMDRLEIPRARVFGYSMGSMIAVELLLTYPERFSAAILGGMGATWPERGQGESREEEPEDFQPPTRRRRSGAFWWDYMRQSNLVALGAVWRGVFRGQQPMPIERLGEIRVPVLAIVGTRDRLAEGAKLLELHIPECRRVMLLGRGHISALADPLFKQAVLEFLAALPDGARPAPSETFV